MEKTKEFDKAWKKTCPICTDNPSNILYYKKQCSACEDKDAKAKKYTEEDMRQIFEFGLMNPYNPIEVNNDNFEYFIKLLNKQD
jgi:hypothetical protein